jgi:hypothetical protein
MMRMTLPTSVCDTARKRPCFDIPKVTKRCSPAEWSGSEPVVENTSRKTVDASSKEAPRFLRLSAAFFGSHAKFTFGLGRVSSPIIGGMIPSRLMIVAPMFRVAPISPPPTPIGAERFYSAEHPCGVSALRRLQSWWPLAEPIKVEGICLHGSHRDLLLVNDPDDAAIPAGLYSARLPFA